VRVLLPTRVVTGRRRVRRSFPGTSQWSCRRPDRTPAGS
jgi:hypothetical protein